ncbi:unnamed protein product [Arctia plantaginis]|uniref:Uncharacterized protein n=1 Tax=Arctia plantaginis TaxID=874455 RepID=A0A8S1B1Q2_ARCPL|nr:unnamed protein product [Arctia plantaginis]
MEDENHSPTSIGRSRSVLAVIKSKRQTVSECLNIQSPLPGFIKAHLCRVNILITPAHTRSLKNMSIRPGERKGDLTVKDVRAFLYKSIGEVYFKLCHPQEYTILPQYPEPQATYSSQVIRNNAIKVQSITRIKSINTP